MYRARVALKGLQGHFVVGLVWLLVGLCLLSGEARAQSAPSPDAAASTDTAPTVASEGRALGVARLLERSGGGTPMHFNDAVYRDFMVAELEAAGFTALPLDDVVLGQDPTVSAAELGLYGELVDFAYSRQRNINCRMAVRWHVRELESKRLVYETTTYGVARDVRPEATIGSVAQSLLRSALSSLLSRPRLVAALRHQEPAQGLIVDEPDPAPLLDSDEAARRAAGLRGEAPLGDSSWGPAQNAGTPIEPLRAHPPPARPMSAAERRVSAARWGGVALGAIGLLTVAISQLSYDKPTTTKADYQTLRLWNDLGWVCLAVGGTSFTASLLFAPSASRARPAAGYPARPPLMLGIQGTY